MAKATDIELGKVNWLRNVKEAQKLAKNNDKPILILFQEVPGCSTCKNYGSNVLSHPLIVEAIESYFIPLCIYNNKGGDDREVLNYFGEPSWNNPVIRIVDVNLQTIVDRLNGNYSAFGLVSKINTCLMTLGIRIPEYLKLLEEETRALQSGTARATLGMYCFWSGEKTYGMIKGIIATKAGFMNGSEVVDITYNPHETTLNDIIKIGKNNHTADKLFLDDPSSVKTNIPVFKNGNFRLDPETKYYLYQTNYKYLPMTEMQSMRANSLLAEGKPCDPVLSPRQIKYYQEIKSGSRSKLINQIGKDITLAWWN